MWSKSTTRDVDIEGLKSIPIACFREPELERSMKGENPGADTAKGVNAPISDREREKLIRALTLLLEG